MKDTKEEIEPGQKICPNCGCFIGGSVGYEQDDVTYCCKSCATGVGLCTCESDETVEEK